MPVNRQVKFKWQLHQLRPLQHFSTIKYLILFFLSSVFRIKKENILFFEDCLQPKLINTVYLQGYLCNYTKNNLLSRYSNNPKRLSPTQIHQYYYNQSTNRYIQNRITSIRHVFNYHFMT